MSPIEEPCGSYHVGAVVGIHKLKVAVQSALAALVLAAVSQPAFAQYTWNNVRIVASGFVPGIVYHPNVQGLVYARTDIGGLYRSTNGGANWVPLLDWVNWSNWGYSGVLSVAVDPQNGQHCVRRSRRLHQRMGSQ